MAFQVIPLSGALGAEICGINLARITNNQFDAVHGALLQYGFVYCRGQALEPGQLRELAARWGELHVHPYMPGLDGFPEVIEIVKKETDRHTFGGNWHTDQMFTATPAMGTMLYAKEVPSAGGDTLFANLYLAYETLSDAMKAMIGPLHTVNIYDKKRKRATEMQRKVVDEDKPAEVVTHPLVRPHSETGRPVLYLSYERITRRIDGMTDEESRPLIDFLATHIVRPEFTCRFRWSKGALAIWDNRTTQHYALNDYQGQRRHMQRVTIKGDRPR